MAKQTTIDDIAESISDLTTMIAAEFTAVRQEMAIGLSSVRQEMAAGLSGVRQEMAAGLSGVRQEMADSSSELRKEMSIGFAEVHKNQRETNQRLARLEDNDETNSADIKALYEMVADIQEDIKPKLRS